MMNNTFKRGFTLIELLVVIAIIGILASVVLASLNSARDKGTNASYKSTINNMRAQAEIFYDEVGTTVGYSGVCTAADSDNDPTDPVTTFDDTIAGAIANVGASCSSDADEYAIAVDLIGSDAGDSYCVDSTGVSEVNTVAAATEIADRVCDGN